MFTINGQYWYVILVPAGHYKLLRSNGIATLGVCDDKDKTIYIQEGLRNSKLRKVLCHEITHAAMFSFNVNLSIEQEELFADLISSYGREIISITNSLFRELKKYKGT